MKRTKYAKSILSNIVQTIHEKDPCLTESGFSRIHLAILEHALSALTHGITRNMKASSSVLQYILRQLCCCTAGSTVIMIWDIYLVSLICLPTTTVEIYRIRAINVKNFKGIHCY